MLSDNESLIRLRALGVGHRGYKDELFANDKPPKRYGIYDEDQEELCHEVIKSTCHIPGCYFECDTLIEYENHYNARHKYTCSQCKKLLPTPHFLDLHVQETHDSFFAVMAERKPSYCCFIEECREKFKNTEERHEHCVQVHKLPKDFRYDQQRKPKSKKSKKKTKTPNASMETEVPSTQNDERSNPKSSKKKTNIPSASMETEVPGTQNDERSKLKLSKKKTNTPSASMESEVPSIQNDEGTKPEPSNKKSNTPSASMETEVPGKQNDERSKPKPFQFQNSKSKGFLTYSGKKFTNDKNNKSERNVNIDEAMEDIRESLPN